MIGKNTIDLDFLIALLQETGASSDEKRISGLFRKYLQQDSDNVYGDIIGNTFATLNSHDGCHILLSSHIDEIGMQVTEICADGLLKIRKVGGVNSLNLIGQEVVMTSSKGIIRGVVVFQNKDNNSIPDADDCYIDIFCKNKCEAEQIVEIGDFFTFSPNARIINDNIISKSIDDRIGVFIVSQVFHELAGKLKNINLSIAATTQEEIGLRGMAVLSRNIAPTMCVNIDVADACQINKKNQPVMGDGCVLYRNADSNPHLRQMLYHIARQENIPLQIAVGRNITGGADSSRIQLFSPKTAVMDLSVPCKYMHTHHEQCSISDVLSCINLLKVLIQHLDNSYQICPPDFTF